MKLDKYQLEIQAKYENLREVIASDKFLIEWLANSEQGRREASIDTSSTEEKELRAKHLGFPNNRVAMEYWANTHTVFKRFVEEDAFKSLWGILKNEDKKSGSLWYSPSNSGFPMKIIDAIHDWYQAPKWTVGEQKKHDKKIVEACDVLLGLIAPVWFGTHSSSRFKKFSRDEAIMPELLRRFQSPDEWSSSEYFAARSASNALTGAGLTPTWAIQAIRSDASYHAPIIKMPTKVRAKNAMKTYLINRLWNDLESPQGLTNAPVQVSQELFSEIVGLIADCDCTAEDVRKALLN